SGNVAVEDGGGGVFYGRDSLMEVTDCNFVENTANYGAALYFDPNCFGTVSDSTLTGNDANGDGGGVFLRYADVIDFNACKISENTAACGGGLYCLYSPDSSIIACEIKRNKASGGVTVWFEYFEPDPNDPNVPLNPESPIDTSDPNFDPNDPNYVKVRREDYSDVAQGGGIYSCVGPRLIKDTEICYNTARTSGGGLYLFGDEDPEYNIGPELDNCLIANNTAGRDGAGISCNWWVEATISNCTIADNKATGRPSYGGGLCCSYDSYAEVINSIIWGNEGMRGSQIAVGSGDWAAPFTSTVRVTYSDVQIFQEEPNEAEEPVDPTLLSPYTPHYFIYHSYDVERSPMGVYGWTDEEEVDRIIYFNGPTAYIYTVTIPDGCDPDTHPENPYAPGDIAERTLTFERSFDLGENFVPSHASAFYVTPDNEEVYVGAYIMGILRYTFDSGEENPVEGGPAGNYVYDDRIAPPTPSSPVSWRMETLAYDPDNDVWYAGGREIRTVGEVWKYEGSQGPDGYWTLAFTYAPPPVTVGLFHHDGMAFANGYLFLSTMYGDRFMQFTPDGTLVNEFTHAPLPDDLESMGWGALGHFWVGSIYTNNVSELGGGAMQLGIEFIPPTSPIYVGEDCELIGWAPDDANDFWTWDVNSWTDDTNNIDEDPCFAADYYLSWADADQDVNSPCVDRGSADVNDPDINLPPDKYTTRTDGVGDIGIVDMGYHHLIDFMPWLNVIVVDANDDPVDPGFAHGYVDPNNRPYPRDTEVELVAHIDYGYRVKEWWGTDDDSSTEPNNTVTMTSDKTVTVEFEESPRHWLSTKVVAGIGTIEPLSGEY
ncbi:MAG: right-handed parallel beta-helix repeat-containing protein, partial [Planctomycetota bacterium]